MLHVDLLILYLQEYIILVFGLKQYLIVFDDLFEFISDIRGKNTSVSCAYDQRIGEMLA